MVATLVKATTLLPRLLHQPPSQHPASALAPSKAPPLPEKAFKSSHHPSSQNPFMALLFTPSKNQSTSNAYQCPPGSACPSSLAIISLISATTFSMPPILPQPASSLLFLQSNSLSRDFGTSSSLCLEWSFPPIIYMVNFLICEYLLLRHLPSQGGLM